MAQFCACFMTVCLGRCASSASTNTHLVGYVRTQKEGVLGSAAEIGAGIDAIASRIRGDYAASSGVAVRWFQTATPVPKNMAGIGCEDGLHRRNNTLIRVGFSSQPTVPRCDRLRVYKAIHRRLGIRPSTGEEECGCI